MMRIELNKNKGFAIEQEIKNFKNLTRLLGWTPKTI